MYLINGAVRENIAVADRGLQYGDGLFETIEVNPGRPVFLERHLNRLQRGCVRLKIPCPDIGQLSFEVKSLADRCCSEPGVVKIIITRGPGGRGYRLPDLMAPTRVISLHPFPEYPKSFQEQGVCVRFCSTRLGLNPTLAGIKHLNRLEQVMARAEWNDATIQEGLMLDLNGHVIEGTMTNLFYVRNGQLHTAPVTTCGIAGIMREVIIELSGLNRLEVTEQFFKKDDLLAADEIFICNSIVGLWPVNRLETQQYIMGPITRQIARWLTFYKQRWVELC